MQKSMRENQLNNEQIDALLAKEHVGHFATINEDGHPYVAPMHYVYMDGKIYMHGLSEGQKIENFKRNPLVGFEIQCCGEMKISKTATTACNVNTEYESVIITGKAKLTEDFEEKKKVLWAIVKKYVPKLEKLPMPDARINGTVVIEVEIESITGKYYKED
ncbi:MAG: pyridoxamine 5'-phosphate oxidase family protein [Clostridia bacterium]|nr:pyridoxamine 5'-phosphate oxidase family protein [Clostridia bacterium]